MIQGPLGTAYSGGYFVVKVTFEAGYPFKTPTVIFQTRIFAVNVLTQVNGTGSMMHLDELWDSKWTMRMLFTHIISFLTVPDMTKVPSNLMHVLNLWLKYQSLPRIHRITGEYMTSEEELEADRGVSAITSQMSYVEFLESLSRIEQMHVNVLSIFICDRERYDKTVRLMTRQYASINPIAHLGLLMETDAAVAVAAEIERSMDTENELILSDQN